MKGLKSKITRIFGSKLNYFILFLVFILIFINIIPLSLYFNYHNNSTFIKKDNLKLNWIWATLELTNPSEVDGKRFPHNSAITIKGRIYSKADGTNKSGINVIIQVDGMDYPSFLDTTNINGQFAIDYTIDPALNVYNPHQIKAIPINYITNPPGGEIENPDFYIINVNTTSHFDINSYDDLSIPKLTEETFNVNGYLRDANDSPISNVDVNYYWLDGPIIISQGIYSTGSSGSLQDVQVPFTLLSQLTLKFDFSFPPLIGYSEIQSPPINVFSDVFWELDYDDTTYIGTQYTISGQLSSLTDNSLKISNRDIDVFYDEEYKGTTSTDLNGRFSYNFEITGDNGSKSFRLELINDAGRFISNERWISVSLPVSSPGTQNELPPFFIFSIIFFPILALIIAGLAVYGYRYYKKQEEESRVINVPLVSKIKNLKLLKESGRLEEALSYLFNAIYMDLVNAKYGRSRKINETIRDFAIISVKELKLTPAAIYPFIQKIEETIYGKPFKITEDDFYKSCELFSPIYYQLTGYNFVLNF